jgi:hypothetical protein
MVEVESKGLFGCSFRHQLMALAGLTPGRLFLTCISSPDFSSALC